jgi:hypothetical protein
MRGRIDLSVTDGLVASVLDRLGGAIAKGGL